MTVANPTAALIIALIVLLLVVHQLISLVLIFRDTERQLDQNDKLIDEIRALRDYVDKKDMKDDK